MAAPSGSSHSRFRALVDAFLLSFLEDSKRSGLTKEAEKEILLSLSLVSREIQKWGEEFSPESKQGYVVNPNSGLASSPSFKQPLEDGHNCLTNIVAVLVMLVRLSSRIQWQHSYAVLWIELLKRYFEDLVYKYVIEYDTGYEDCLEGSPFLASIAAGENDNLYSRHLQR